MLPMSRMIFVNLPVKDLPRSIAFFRALGFTFNEQMTNDQAAFMNVSDQAAVMLVTEPFFKSFSDKAIADTSTQMEVQNAVSAESREEVDDLVEKAIAAGARSAKPALDEGFMYSRGFQDPDGHLWDFVWMDPSAIPA
jgi:predicted lactoylglutathione lyase